MSSKILLISIRPKYASKIFDGSKTIELRRIKPKLSENDIIVIYVSSPVKQIQGVFEVKKISQLPINELWDYVESEAGLSRIEFDQYFLGVSSGCGIKIGNIAFTFQPIDLHEIKRKWKGFNPPQCYRYLSQSEYSLLLSLSNSVSLQKSISMVSE